MPKVEVVDGLSDTYGLRVHYFPETQDQDPEGRFCVRVDSDDGEWFGLFAEGARRDGAHGCWPVPGGDRHLVCAKGAPYLLDPGPEAAEELKATVLRVFPRDDALVCATSTEVFALRKDRVLWRTRRIALDGLTADLVGDELVGTATTPEGVAAPFRVDMKTGAITGGWEPRRRDEMG